MESEFLGWLAPGLYGICVRRWYDRLFPGHRIGRRGPVEWPPTSPDLIPLDFYLCGYLKGIVYQVKIQNMNHLKERIGDECARITPDGLKRVRHKWERQIRVRYQCRPNGAHIEQVL
ncbi:hypothetical protein Cfor_05280 [Coptotermes formosanus]|uniref:Uncharacterized protein n=1 Tax=Coptotermes formosanus TaxID=36987 RepID=A0A6L2PZC4_COPFO|nr:hypothetical protein Cfor_05280 [Coptotermes formosanus]